MLLRPRAAAGHDDPDGASVPRYEFWETCGRALNPVHPVHPCFIFDHDHDQDQDCKKSQHLSISLFVPLCLCAFVPCLLTSALFARSNPDFLHSSREPTLPTVKSQIKLFSLIPSLHFSITPTFPSPPFLIPNSSFLIRAPWRALGLAFASFRLPTPVPGQM